jgi:hypothetical protein|tara:strand:- start:3092 stop:3358 length:267 start_codon:yes stop_codon:yes gene_type:complete
MWDITTMDRSEMIEELLKRECRVIFRKVNGESRDMICTLNPDVIPTATKSDPLSQTKIRELNEEVLAVWDVKAAGWRSFRVGNVVSFS